MAEYLEARVERMNDHFTKFHIDRPGNYLLAGGKNFYFHRPGVAHRFIAGDGPDADPHDHPWPFTCTILEGGYREEVFDLDEGRSELRLRMAGDCFRNEAGTIHRILHLIRTGAADPVCWTFIEPGEAERKPGFYQFRADGTYHRYRDELGWSRLPR